MSKLTLPIVIGRRYVRRDGAIVTVRTRHAGIPNAACAYAGDGNEPTSLHEHHVWLDTGRVGQITNAKYPYDLVADYIEGGVVDAELPKGSLHPYFMVLRWIADGLPVQRNIGGVRWTTQSPATTLSDIAEGVYSPDDFRLPPKTIRIGEFDVPEPLREAPAADTQVWVVDIEDGNDPTYIYWNWASAANRIRLKLGLVHLERDAAALHARALLSFTSTTGAPAA